MSSSLGGQALGVSPSQPNFLIFLLDDLGRDQVRQYEADPDATEADQPNLDALIQNGVLFDRAYTQPWCSPTRACIHTARWGFQTGIMQLAEGTSQPLLETEVCLPAALKAACPSANYICGVFGKWHLSSYSSNPDPTKPPSVGEREHPIRCGYDEWFGQLRNFGTQYDGNYQTWTAQSARKGPLGIRSSSRTITGYAPLVQAEKAITFMQSAVSEGRPFLCYVPVNLPHDPLHRPPADLYDTTTYVLDTELPPDGVSQDTRYAYFKAMIQAADTIFGRLLASLDPGVLANTYVIWASDNGTQSENVPPSLNPLFAKRTVMELGIRNPLVISGPAVAEPGRLATGLVCHVDLFPTIIALAGGDASLVPLPPGGTRAGQSFAAHLTDSAIPIARTYGWADLAQNIPHLNCSITGTRALFTTTHKLIQKNSTGVTAPANGSAVSSTWEFYDLQHDDNEKCNLIGSQPTGGVFPEDTVASPFVSAGVFTLTNGNATFPGALTAYNALKAQFATFTASY